MRRTIENLQKHSKISKTLNTNLLADSYLMTVLFVGCIFQKCIFPEGLAKEPPKMDWLGGQSLG